MSSFEKEMLSACKSNLACERRNLKVLKRLLNSPKAIPRAKEVLEQLVWNYEFRIKNGKKFIKHSTRP